MFEKLQKNHNTVIQLINSVHHFTHFTGVDEAWGVNIHEADLGSNRGSSNCFTIHPDDALKVWEILQERETGTVEIYRLNQ